MTRTTIAAIAGLIVIVLGGAWMMVDAGFYDVGADVPHSAAFHAFLSRVRDRSIEAHARNIVAPSDLAKPARVARGAGLYKEMCSSCHLGPGVERTEISQGLYPKAPELTRGNDLTPAEKFWVIKHGIKMTAMPSWGVTHSDTLIWDMVAFLQKASTLTAAQFEALANSAPDHDAMMKDMPMGGHTPPK